MTSKKVTKSGAITLPKQMRTEAGIFAGNAVDIEMSDDGIKIKKHVPTCQFCGSTDGVKSVIGIEICPSCAFKIHEKVVCSNE